MNFKTKEETIKSLNEAKKNTKIHLYKIIGISALTYVISHSLFNLVDPNIMDGMGVVSLPLFMLVLASIITGVVALGYTVAEHLKKSIGIKYNININALFFKLPRFKAGGVAKRALFKYPIFDNYGLLRDIVKVYALVNNTIQKMSYDEYQQLISLNNLMNENEQLFKIIDKNKELIKQIKINQKKIYFQIWQMLNFLKINQKNIENMDFQNVENSLKTIANQLGLDANIPVINEKILPAKKMFA